MFLWLIPPFLQWTHKIDNCTEQRLVFDEAASLYDQYRANYPPQLAADLLTLANVAAGDRILEIGCGTGKATIHFAPYGFPLLALEPGAAMCAIARQKCADFPNVGFRNDLFEEWSLEAEAFKLIYAAMALHWVDPEIAFTKTAAALAPGGTLACIWNRPQESEDALRQEIRRAYDKVKHVKQPQKAHPQALYEGQGGTIERFNASRRFGTVFSAEYPHSAQYSADEYIKLMQTMSDHRIMPEAEREWLYGEIFDAIERFGGVIKVDYLVTLYFARRV
ncbi:MAG: class I SAM-dependent methyltransferase [Caldilineaceae bacterium]